jgi:thiol-disulfide isomerase/thioredoxin
MPGNAVPDLSEGTWLNTNAKSLQDFRGKYVLLDFWFIGCGPCMVDMPSIKLAHQLFGEHGFSVVSVHTSHQTASDVQAFANQHEMNYPIVVDNSEDPITKGFKPLGRMARSEKNGTSLCEQVSDAAAKE